MCACWCMKLRVQTRILKVEFFLSCWCGFVLGWMVWITHNSATSDEKFTSLPASLSRQHFSQLFDYDLYSACKDGKGASEQFHGAQVRKRHLTKTL